MSVKVWFFLPKAVVRPLRPFSQKPGPTAMTLTLTVVPNEEASLVASSVLVGD
jgi:hypothetical protein